MASSEGSTESENLEGMEPGQKVHEKVRLATQLSTWKHFLAMSCDRNGRSKNCVMHKIITVDLIINNIVKDLW